MANKKWKYHKSHSFVADNEKYNVLTQLYKIGVYVIINSEAGMQFHTSPAQMVTRERKLRKYFEKGTISDLEFGVPITVTTDEAGMYVEI